MKMEIGDIHTFLFIQLEIQAISWQWNRIQIILHKNNKFESSSWKRMIEIWNFCIFWGVIFLVDVMVDCFVLF